MEDKILKYAIENREYNKCVGILKQRIIECLGKEIKKKYNGYKYTNIIDLINACEKYLEGYSKIAIKDVYKITSCKLDNEIKTSLLIDIYKGILEEII